MKILPIFVMLVLSVLVLPLAGADIGIGTVDLKDNYVDVMEGSSKVIRFTLQNTEDYELNAAVGVNGAVARLVNSTGLYVLPSKSVDTVVEVNVTAPPTARAGDEFVASISMSADLRVEGGSTIGIVPDLGRQFKVRIVKNPEIFNKGEFLTTAGMISVLVVIFLIFTVIGIRMSLRKGAKRKKQ